MAEINVSICRSATLPIIIIINLSSLAQCVDCIYHSDPQIVTTSIISNQSGKVEKKNKEFSNVKEKLCDWFDLVVPPVLWLLSVRPFRDICLGKMGLPIGQRAGGKTKE